MQALLVWMFIHFKRGPIALQEIQIQYHGSWKDNALLTIVRTLACRQPGLRQCCCPGSLEGHSEEIGSIRNPCTGEVCKLRGANVLCLESMTSAISTVSSSDKVLYR